MRFRLTTKPPLKPLKAWFDITDSDSSLDISSLKAQICSRLLQLSDDSGAGLSAVGLELSIDDFVLLDDSSSKVIRENDLVCISRRADPANSKKRKATSAHESRRKKRKTAQEQPQKKRQQHSSEDEDSSSSSSSEEASSSASSSSSTSSSSSSSSSSELDSDSTDSMSESTVEVLSSRITQQVKHDSDKRKKGDSVLPVRPGEGKQSTHSRNARRRLKRLHEKDQMQAEHAIPNGSANGIPLGPRTSAVSTHSRSSETHRVPLEVSNASAQIAGKSPFRPEGVITTLRNKNKKKGFNKTMTDAIPQKIIFSEQNDVPRISTASTFSSDIPATPTALDTQVPRLVTPSEKQTLGLLPSNMFVTSVEVEGAYDRKKKKQRFQYGYEDDALPLEHGEPVAEICSTKTSEVGVDWTSIEQTWDNFTSVTDVSTLLPGVVIGWKALAINPVTFTPESLVHLGRIKETGSTSEIRIVPIRRPGASQISFGASNAEDVVEENTEVDDVVEQEEIFTLEDALKIPWKLVRVL